MYRLGIEPSSCAVLLVVIALTYARMYRMSPPILRAICGQNLVAKRRRSLKLARALTAQTCQHQAAILVANDKATEQAS